MLYIFETVSLVMVLSYPKCLVRYSVSAIKFILNVIISTRTKTIKKKLIITGKYL